MKKPFGERVLFPLSICLVMAIVSTASFMLLKPTGTDIFNADIIRYATIAGYATGPVIGIISFVFIGVVNLVRRMFRLRRVRVLHGLVVLAGVIPWLIAAWNITSEPRYTPVARAIIDFVGRPMLWGALTACLVTALASLITVIPRKAE